eukprot:scaffold114596_cov21-Tisochrysis_lutea.AAC.2
MQPPLSGPHLCAGTQHAVPPRCLRCHLPQATASVLPACLQHRVHECVNAYIICGLGILRSCEADRKRGEEGLQMLKA